MTANATLSAGLISRIQRQTAPPAINVRPCRAIRLDSNAIANAAGGITLFGVFAWSTWRFGVWLLQAACTMEAQLATMVRGGLS